MLALWLFQLVNSVSLISYYTVFYALSYILNYSIALAIEYSLTANLLVYSLVVIKSFN